MRPQWSAKGYREILSQCSFKRQMHVRLSRDRRENKRRGQRNVAIFSGKKQMSFRSDATPGGGCPGHMLRMILTVHAQQILSGASHRVSASAYPVLAIPRLALPSPLELWKCNPRGRRNSVMVVCSPGVGKAQAWF